MAVRTGKTPVASVKKHERHAGGRTPPVSLLLILSAERDL